jgi:hypothetical protein
MMTHAEQTAESLTIWTLGRVATGTLNPADLYRTLTAALQDAEARGARLANLEAPPDPLPEPARPLNAHVGRRRAGAYFMIEGPADGRTVDLSGLHFYSKEG